MQRWEYHITRIEKMSNAEVTMILDRFGSDGWELVSVGHLTDYCNYVFKRP